MGSKIKVNISFLERFCHIAEMFGVMVILVMALIFQFYLKELPCPLCLLQRVGFFMIAIGLLMNLKYGFRPSHYSMVLLGAIFTCFVALRQIALHVIPGTGAYGSAIFNYHLYTWSFIAASLILIATTIMLSVDRQYQYTIKHTFFKKMVHLLFIFLIALLITNIVFVFLECGFSACPDNPMHYRILKYLSI